MEKRAWVEVDLKKIERNVEKMKDYTGRKFMACVKADCYGMGMCEVSRRIEKRVDFFGVATTSEAVTLRDCGIKKPVLVLGPVLSGDVETLVARNVRITLFDGELLKAVSSAARKTCKKAIVHIKIDTGLGRIGVNPESAGDFVLKAAGEKEIEIEGIFTHFATAGWEDKAYAKMQISRFNETLSAVSSCNIPVKHIANSSAILNLPETYRNFDMIRIGLLMFGVYPEKEFYAKLPLECAAKGFCRVNYIKTVPKGTHLSYGITYKTSRASTKIATTGIGYADGLKRRLSNKFYFSRNGCKIRIVGNICMDQALADVTGHNIKTGDTLQVFGDNFEIENMADIVKTVPQEILCGFGSARMAKVYLNGKRK
ncbi:MAG: alanine racemase [Candidatus Omnitrophica bacterium]|nr:alanine racemase [Candidatus Omnitrophota bacterium]